MKLYMPCRRRCVLPTLLMALPLLAVVDLPALWQMEHRRKLQGSPPAPIPVVAPPSPSPLPVGGRSPPAPVSTPALPPNGSGSMGKVAVLIIGQLRGYFQETEKNMHFLIDPLKRDFGQVRQLVPVSSHNTLRLFYSSMDRSFCARASVGARCHPVAALVITGGHIHVHRQAKWSTHEEQEGRRDPPSVGARVYLAHDVSAHDPMLQRRPQPRKKARDALRLVGSHPSRPDHLRERSCRFCAGWRADRHCLRAFATDRTWLQVCQQRSC